MSNEHDRHSKDSTCLLILVQNDLANAVLYSDLRLENFASIHCNPLDVIWSFVIVFLSIEQEVTYPWAYSSELLQAK